MKKNAALAVFTKNIFERPQAEVQINAGGDYTGKKVIINAHLLAQGKRIKV